MRPLIPAEPTPDDPRRVRLALLASHEHLLYRLAEAIDWARFLGQEGDRINALLTGCGFSLRKLWRFFKAPASLQPA